MRPREASTSGFMSEYTGRTWQNPMDRNSRGWSFRNREGEDMPIILTDLEEIKGGGWEPHIWFKTIMSPEKKGAGMASYVLKQITEMADKHGVILKLTAKPFGGQTGALNKSKLIAWYKRNGFEGRDKDFRDQLVRYPGGKKRSAAVKVPRKLYHASFGDAVRKIKSGGLKPGTSSTSLWFDHSSGFVYATSDPTDAFGYVEMYLEQSGMYDEDEPITVFEIDTAQTDLSDWEKDPWNDYPSIQSFAYAGNIPASALRVVRASRGASARRVASLAKEAIACGKCFSWATENAKGSDRVVHGNIKGLRGPHAWIERGDRVFDWQTDVLQWYFSEGLGKQEYRDTGWPKDEFYKTFKPRNLKKYKAGDAKKNDRIVPLGPWHGVPPQYMVKGLIDPVGGDDKLIGFRGASPKRVAARSRRSR